MGDVSTSQWIQFFRNAGMPLNVAANYAIIFYDNRIQLNMLMDLSKEYLYDMGIRVMGDVIAILRYAKEYHNQMVKEKMIGEPSTPGAQRSSPMTRILKHYTRPDAPSARTIPVVQSKSSRVTNFVNVPRKAPALSMKRTLVNLSGPSANEVLPSKKVRLIQPTIKDPSMHVKMPSGKTERSRKLLQLQQQQQSVKRSVFDRLGDSHVSSSTDVKQSASVFNRLGPSSTTEVTTSTEDDDGPLQYRGVLKNLSSAKPARATAQSNPSVKTVMTGKMIRMRNNASSTVGVKPPIGRRTVLQSARDLQASNVNQINKILAQNVSQISSPKMKRIFKPTVGFQNKGIRLGLVTRTMGKSPQKVAVVQGKGKLVSLRNNESKFAHPNRQSVFQRLGKK